MLDSQSGSSTGWSAGSSRTFIAPSWAGVTVSRTGPGGGAVTGAGMVIVNRAADTAPATAAISTVTPPLAQTCGSRTTPCYGGEALDSGLEFSPMAGWRPFDPWPSPMREALEQLMNEPR